jgi:hypothetical protein
LGNDLPGDLVPQSGNICVLLLALKLLGCHNWLLGQEGKVPGCSGGTAVAAEETASNIVVDAGTGVLEGDFA